MKRQRYKRLHRILTFYKHNFQLRPPFKVLVDGTFCSAALAEKINIREQLVKYLEDDSCRIETTSCCLAELDSLGGAVHGARHICGQFDLARCGHAKQLTLTASQCLAKTAKRAAKAAHRVIVATQDRQLTELLRGRQGQPIMFIKHKTVLMEKPSDASSQAAQRGHGDKLLGAQASHALAQLRAQRLGESAAAPPRRKIRKGPKGPNPLSCKKSTKNKRPTAQSAASRPAAQTA